MSEPLSREDLVRTLRGAVLLAPLTRAGNLPFRRLCVELGARFTCSEMIDARRLVRGASLERALLRRHETEPCFGVQLAARNPEDAVAAAREAVASGASYVDLNMGCPIDTACRRGLGAALLEKPRRIERLVRALREALDVPVFAKIRTGYRDGKENAVAIARLLEDGGVDAIAVHGRTREQRYRRPADWERIGEVASAVAIPVIGNGDLLHVSDVRRRLEESGCTAVMLARGALVQPSIFEDLAAGADRPRSGLERLAIARRWVELALECWGSDEMGFRRIRPFLELHLDFWRRHVPLDADVDGTPGLQDRASFTPRDDIEEVLLARDDAEMERACELVLRPFEPPDVALVPSGRRRSASGGWA